MITVKELLQKEPKGANLIDILENSEFETVYTERLDEIKSMSTGQQFIEMQKLIFVFDDVIFNAHEKLITQTHKHNGNCNSIYDYNDELEIAIKTNLFEGDKVKNFKALCQLIGLEIILHRAELSNMNGRKQRNKIEKVLSQYLIFEREDNKQEITIKTVFDIPDYIDFLSKRGQNAEIKKRTVPLLADVFLNKKEEKFNSNTKKLAKHLCDFFEDNNIIRKSCKNTNDKKEPYRFYNAIIARARPITKRWVYIGLNSLEKEYNAIIYNDIIVLKYYDNVKERDDETIIYKSDNEYKIIQNAIAKILLEYKLAKMFFVYQKGRVFINRFFKRVVEYINENKELFSIPDIILTDFYYAIEIVLINKTQLEIAKNSEDKEFLYHNKKYLTERLFTLLDKQNNKEIDNTNAKALVNVNEEIKELYNIGLIDREDVIKYSHYYYTEQNRKEIRYITEKLVFGESQLCGFESEY